MQVRGLMLCQTTPPDVFWCDFGEGVTNPDWNILHVEIERLQPALCSASSPSSFLSFLHSLHVILNRGC